MKVRGDNKPDTLFSCEQIPKKPGKALLRFFKNAKQYTRTEDGVRVTGWEWDEYHLELTYYAELEADVAAHLDDLLAQAVKMEEDANRIQILMEENRLLTAQVDAQSSQLDFYEDCIAEMAEIVYA